MVDSEELSSDFSGPRYLISLIDLGSLRNLSGLNHFQNPFFLQKIPDLDDPTWYHNDQYWSLFVDWIIKNPKFY